MPNINILPKTWYTLSFQILIDMTNIKGNIFDCDTMLS